MPLDPVELLQKLIEIPSINPMGRDMRGPQLGEGRLTDFLQLQCERLGLPWLRQRVHPGRDNLLALWPGNPPVEEGGEFLLWDVHQDTVAADRMTIDPFAADQRDGKIFGRGACDDKGPMAAMLAAISRLAEPSVDPSPQGRGAGFSPTIVIAFTVNEECGFTGVRSLCDLWNCAGVSAADIVGGNISPTKMFPRPADAAIVAEPTSLDVVVAHQGVVRWRCHTIGRAAHTSRPDAGINAIYAMAEIVQAVERYHAELQKKAPIHSLCGRPSVCVSTMHGGVGVNTVPERATIEVDRRLAPEERPESAYDDLVRHVAEHTSEIHCRVEHDPPFMQSSGLSEKRNQRLALGMARVVHELGRRSELVGVPYATDAAAIASAGLPAIVFGPGSISQAHTADEFITVDQLCAATDIFYRIAHDGLRK